MGRGAFAPRPIFVFACPVEGPPRTARACACACARTVPTGPSYSLVGVSTEVAVTGGEHL